MPSGLAVHLALAVASVGAVSSVKGVRALVTDEGIVAVAPGQGVVTRQAVQDVRSRIAGQVVVEPAAVWSRTKPRTTRLPRLSTRRVPRRADESTKRKTVTTWAPGP